ncbi:hypothetical protein PQQ87_08710 [Paraburkholderia nemoris]|uniref:hypothetical protein n=1 Tax=Paraburkholderia nemoris TaxID=2793076 RepID=UPI0038BCD0C5
MTNPVFPNIVSAEPVSPQMSTGEDSKNFGIEYEDPSMQTKMDGGYVVSRAKFTRTPRRTWTSGYTSISNSDKQILSNFYQSVMGGSVIFDWTSPQDGQIYQVRFISGSLKFRYTGIGTSQLWDVTYQVQEA